MYTFRTLVLSDIHANRAALQAVLADAMRRFRPDELWNLGDTVGYGPEPLAVWQALQLEPIPPGCWLAGNHDWGLLDRLPLSVPVGDYDLAPFRREAAKVLQLHRELLAETNTSAQLADCPVLSQPFAGVYLTHGSFADTPEASVSKHLVTSRMRAPLLSPHEMVSSFWQAAAGTDVFAAGPADTPPRLLAFGHNHLQAAWYWNGTGWQSLTNGEWQAGDADDEIILVNPGGVGFARDGSGCPGYAIIEWDGSGPQRRPLALKLCRARYDTGLTRALMQVEPYFPLLNEPYFLPETSANGCRELFLDGDDRLPVENV